MGHNEERGLTIQGTDFAFLAEGSYGTIFFDVKRQRVRKIFRAHNGPEHASLVFDAEVAAYRLAEANLSVGGLVPKFFGKISEPQQIIDRSGRDVSNEFHVGFTYEMEFIAGEFHKIGAVDEFERERIQSAFNAVGIHHVSDMSVSLAADRTIAKCIDFASKEFVAEHRDLDEFNPLDFFGAPKSSETSSS